jgi:ribonuclease HI
MDSSRLVIVQHNIGSLKPKISLLNNFLDNHNVDICILNETWLRASDFIQIRGYQIFRRDSDNGYGGVAILCKNYIRCTNINLWSSDKIQTLAVNIKIKNNSFTILGIYCPPRSGRFPISVLKSIISSLSSPLLVMGDFNAHHTAFGSASNKTRGIQLFDMLDEINMCILNTGETTTVNRPNQLPSAIDIAFSSPCLAASADWSVLSDDALGSYHFPTLINLSISVELYEHVSSYQKYVYKKADWVKYSEISSYLFDEVLQETNALNAYDRFCILLDNLRKESVPIHSYTFNGQKCRKPVPWWNDICSDAVNQCKLALYAYKRYPTVENYLLYKKFDALKKKTIKEQKILSWKHFCSSFDRNTPISRVWKLVKVFNRKTSSPKCNDDHFVDAFLDKIASNRSSQHIDQLNEFFDFNELNLHLNLPFSEQEFNYSLNNKKDTTPGLDDIPYILIKRLHQSAKLVLLRIFNDLWQFDLIPDTWKTTAVVPILKSEKDPSLAESYRPISLSSCVGKIFENMIKCRLEMYAESRLIIPSSQFGFRKGRSTTDSLLKFGGDIKDAFYNNQYLISVFLDVSGAFDNVDLECLVKILHSYNIPGKICKWIFNFFYSRTVYIKYGGKLYGPKLAYKGVMQGATLSPLIYILYIAQLHSFLPTNTLSVLQYADDIVLYTTSRNILVAQNTINDGLTNLYQYFKETLKLDINPNKSSAMIFSKKLEGNVNISITYSAVSIRLVEEKNILGVIFDSQMYFNSHVQKVVNKMQKSVNVMRHLASVTWGMDPKLLNMIFKSIVRSHYDYALIVYGNCISSILARKLEVIQNKGLRIITGAFCSTPINSLEVEAGISPIDIRTKYLVEKFYCKILTNTHYLYLYRNNSILKGTHCNELDNLCKHIDHRDQWELSSLEIQLTIPHVCIKEIRSNNDFLDFVNNEKPDYRRIYTDGSKTNEFTKAAYYDSSAKFGRCFNLDNNASVFTAEVYAIYTALQYIRAIPNHTCFLIVTDSLSTLDCLKNPKISYKNNIYITRIREYLLSNMDQIIEFIWVPSHSGITGNEVVDKLMKISTPQIDNLVFSLPSVPFTDFNSMLKLRMFDSWSRDWEYTRQFKGKWYAEIQKHITKKPWYFNLILPTRKFITTLCRLRLGHGKFASHLKRINVIRSAICQYCSIEEASLEHLILHCSAFSVQRLILVDGLMQIYKDDEIPRLLPSILQNMKTYNLLFEYVDSTIKEL